MKAGYMGQVFSASFLRTLAPGSLRQNHQCSQEGQGPQKPMASICPLGRYPRPRSVSHSLLKLSYSPVAISYQDLGGESSRIYNLGQRWGPDEGGAMGATEGAPGKGSTPGFRVPTVPHCIMRQDLTFLSFCSPIYKVEIATSLHRTSQVCCFQ